MWRGLLCDHGIDEVVEIRGETLECQVRVLSQHICCQVIVVVLDVQQEKVGKRLCQSHTERENGEYSSDYVNRSVVDHMPRNSW